MVRPFNPDFRYAADLQSSTSIVAALVMNKATLKQTVAAATTANVTIATALNVGDSIDGVTLVEGDRVLVWQQSTGSQNGIYVVGTTPARAPDFDSSDEIVGSYVPVTGGTVYAGSLFRNTNTAPVVVDTDDITFELFGGGTSIPFDHGNMGAAETLDLADSDWHRGTLNADCTITVAGFSVDEGATLLFECTQDGTGGWAITWDADVLFVASDQPGQAAGDVTFFVLWTSQGDATIYGATIGAGLVSPLTTKGDLWGYSTADARVPVGSNGQVLTADDSVALGVAYTTLVATGGDSAHAHVNDVLYSGDGSTTAFTLPVAPVDAYAVQAFVSGILTEVTLSGGTLQTATFGSAPASATDNVRFDIVAAID